MLFNGAGFSDSVLLSILLTTGLLLLPLTEGVHKCYDCNYEETPILADAPINIQCKNVKTELDCDADDNGCFTGHVYPLPGYKVMGFTSCINKAKFEACVSMLPNMKNVTTRGSMHKHKNNKEGNIRNIALQEVIEFKTDCLKRFQHEIHFEDNSPRKEISVYYNLCYENSCNGENKKEPVSGSDFSLKSKGVSASIIFTVVFIGIFVSF